MNSVRSLRRAGVVLAALAGGFFAIASQHKVLGQDQPKKTATAWSLDEALQQLAFHPKDPYLQYVALQLGKREGREKEVLDRIAPATGRGGRPRADLFSTFSGALALQESLQLDTMRGDRPPRDPQKSLPGKVAVAALKGPAVKSHPWEKMLGGRRPAIDMLSLCVPEDFWFAEFRSLAKLNEISGLGQLWGGHIFTQALGTAKSPETAERIRKQLGLTKLPPKLVESLEIERIALTGSDLFVGEGSDITLLIESKKLPNMLRMLEGIQARRGRKESGRFLGVQYIHQISPDGSTNYFSANPRPDLHVRSTSLAALTRVLEAVIGKTAVNGPARRLGDSKEYQYIRTLMPAGAAEEDGFVYLSDPFIRRLVGPQVKLTERRRVLVYNHLRMINHASLLFRSEFGRPPRSLEELAETKCAPGVFGRDDLAHPDGGTYLLAPDGMSGLCSKYGRAESLSPCLEHLVSEVSGQEAEEYKAFVEEYNQYWRTYFDPIAIRIQASDKQYRLETLVLPLIDNSIYSAMAQAWGGKAAALDVLPTPKREIGGLWLHLPKQVLLDLLEPQKEGRGQSPAARQRLLPDFRLSDHDIALMKKLGLDLDKLRKFLRDGIGDQIGLQMHDGQKPLDFDIGAAMSGHGDALGTGLTGPSALGAGLAVQFLTGPSSISIPVADTLAVDEFLNEFDKFLLNVKSTANRDFGGIGSLAEFYRMPFPKPHVVRCLVINILGLKLRLFWGRIGNGLYIANRPFLLEDIAAAQAKPKTSRPPELAHALLRVRPENWNEVLPGYNLSWAENNRNACHDNLSMIANVHRGWNDREPRGNGLDALLLDRVVRLYGVRPFCPDGGKYALSMDGKSCSCSIHGDPLNPKQLAAPDDNSPTGKLFRSFGGLNAALTFEPDGLRAVFTVERR